MGTVQVDNNDFVIIKFKDSNYKELDNELAIVPVKFTKFDQEKNHFSTKYLDPPYGTEDLKLIEDIVESNGYPPDAWSYHKCEALFFASTYKSSIFKIII